MDDSRTTSEIESIYDNPAKDFVRDRWVDTAQARREASGLEYVNYFTLPGPQCLDVLRFRDAGLLKMKDSVYEPDSLTFCENQDYAFALIRDQLPNAKDVKLPFEDLVGALNPQFIHQWVNQKKLFPYDVLNLDFEVSPFFLRSRDASRQVGAIEKVFDIQRGYAKSFTLFVTCQGENGVFDQRGENYIREVIQSNLDDGPEDFRVRYSERYNDQSLPSPHYEAFLIVVPKLVLRLGWANQYEVVCSHRLTYVGAPRATTRMVSFIFECEYRGGHTSSQSPPVGQLSNTYDSEILKLVDEPYIDVNRELSLNRG